MYIAVGLPFIATHRLKDTVLIWRNESLRIFICHFSLRSTPCIDVYLATWHILLKRAETHFIPQHVVCLGDCSMDTWKECVFGYCWMECLIPSKSSFFTLVVSLLVPSSNKRRVFKFPTVIADLFISSFSFASCFVYFDSLLIGCVHIWNYFAFQRISPFIIMKCPYSSAVIPYPAVYFIWY